MTAPAVPRRWSPADSVLVLLLLLAGAAIGIAAISLRPDLTRGSGFLFGDEGFSLYVADQLLRGRQLYVEVAYMYGPVPAFLHAGWALIFGNTPSTYLALHLVISLCNLALGYALVRLWTSTTTAAIVCFVGLLPLLVVPGAILGGYVSSPYQPLERSLMLVAALLWRPPRERTFARGAALGALLGGVHLVRFGTGAFVLLSVLLVDTLVMLRPRLGTSREWSHAATVPIAGFVAAELAIVAALFTWLPAPIAADVAWPSYMLRAFDDVLADRWPRWEGWRVFAGQYLTVASAVALTIAMAFRPRRGRMGHQGWVGLFLPAIFFLFGCLWFFRSVHHFRQFAWTLVFPAAMAIERHRALRSLAVVVWLPVLGLVIRSVVGTPPDGFDPVALRSGGSVTLSPHLRERVDALSRALDREHAGTTSAVWLPNGAGFHAAFDVPAASRHVFFFAGAVQPDEIAATLAQFARAPALVVCEPGDPGVPDPTRSSELFPPYLPRELAGALQSRIVERVWSDGGCGLFRLSVESRLTK